MQAVKRSGNLSECEAGYSECDRDVLPLSGTVHTDDNDGQNAECLLQKLGYSRNLCLLQPQRVSTDAAVNGCKWKCVR